LLDRVPRRVGADAAQQPQQHRDAELARDDESWTRHARVLPQHIEPRTAACGASVIVARRPRAIVARRHIGRFVSAPGGKHRLQRQRILGGTGMGLGTTAIRGTLGPLFVGHGTQKLFGWFDGHGLEATAGGFESMGLRPGKRHAIAAGAAEAAGGALLTLGAFTPLAAGMITGAMVTAIRKVHAKNGPWVTSGGWEYNAVIIAAMAVLADHGPGRPSVDAALFPRLKGPAWAALAIGAGVAGSYAITSPPLNQPAPVPAEGQGGAGDVASPNGEAATTQTAGTQA
jgi:putative oxidoreductase